MGNIFYKEFREFIDCLNRSEVEYLLVGGYSVILHGYIRTTGDLDVWVNKTEHNYLKLCRAFQLFGMPVYDMTLSNFMNQSSDFDVFGFGRRPIKIEILTKVKGLKFDESFKMAQKIESGGLLINLIHFDHLIQAKKAAGRPQDLTDLENLKE